MKRVKILRAFDGHSLETVTLNKYIAEYEQLCKRMVKFLSKFQGHGIRIDNDSSIRVGVADPFIFFNILRAVAR